MHDHRVVKAEARVVVGLVRRVHADDHRERGRGDHIGIARLDGGVPVTAQLVRLADRVGEVGDLDPAYLVGRAGTVDPADELSVQCHPSPRRG